jgi:hypothetical protein
MFAWRWLGKVLRSLQDDGASQGADELKKALGWFEARDAKNARETRLRRENLERATTKGI